MGHVECKAEEQRKQRTRVLAAALCACALVAFTAARSAHPQPGRLQHVISNAPAAVSIYSWSWDGPEFAVVTFTSAPRPLTVSAPLFLFAQPVAAASLLEFSQHVRPPPAL